MSQTYKIETLGGPNRWDNDPNKGDYFATLTGFDGEVLIFHDASSNYDPPKIGDELFGTVEKDKRGNLRFKRASRNRSTQSSGGGGGQRSDHVVGLRWASAPYERGAEHPRNEVRMIHTSALSATVPFINQLLAFGLIEAPKDEDAYWTLVGRVAGRLSKSYVQPLRATEGPSEPPSQPQLNGGEVPADTAEMVPAAAPAGSDSDVPF